MDHRNAAVSPILCHAIRLTRGTAVSTYERLNKAQAPRCTRLLLLDHILPYRDTRDGVTSKLRRTGQVSIVSLDIDVVKSRNVSQSINAHHNQ